MDRLGPERMFLTVVETGSFAAAATRLGTGSGQASKLVARLEADLGVKLLNRTTRALSLTEAGQAYAERLRMLVEGLDDLQTEVQNAAISPRGLIRLAVPLSFGTTRLAPLLARFAVEYPEIALEVHFADRIVNLVEEGYDAAIRVGNPTDATLTGRKLGSAQLLVVASPAYLAAHPWPKVPEDLVQHSCIIDLNLREPYRWPFRGGKVTVSGRLAFSNATACLAATEAGLGIARIPDFIAETAVATGRVVPLLQDHELPPLGVHALYPSGRHLPAKLRVMVDFMAKALR